MRNTFGEPIPGLFAVGELGQATGMQYPADSSNLFKAFCFGQIAVQSALGSRNGIERSVFTQQEANRCA